MFVNSRSRGKRPQANLQLERLEDRTLLSFGTGGSVFTVFGKNSVNNGETVTMQTDGKILAAGKVGSTFGLGRYNPDGSLDTSFNARGSNHTQPGTVLTPFSSGTAYLEGMVLQPDGKIVVGGPYFGSGVLALARYNTDGTPDTTFGANGIEISNLSGQRDSASSVVALESVNGNTDIVIAGLKDGKFVVARFNPNGSPDTSFGSNGEVQTNVSSLGGDGALSVAVQADGKIVATGDAKVSLGPTGPVKTAFCTVRYNTNGTLDTSFGGTGIVLSTYSLDPATSFPGDVGWGVAIQPDGRIAVAGRAMSAGTNTGEFAVLRYNSDGSLDTTFGNGGVATAVSGSSVGAARAITIQADGKIVAAGTGYPTYPGSQNMTTIARFNTDGSLDTTFNGTGVVFANPGSSIASFATGVAVQPADGKIVTIGDATDFVLMRFNPDGSLDSGSAPSSPGRMMRTGGSPGSVTVKSAGQAAALLFTRSNPTGSSLPGAAAVVPATPTASVGGPAQPSALAQNQTLTSPPASSRIAAHTQAVDQLFAGAVLEPVLGSPFTE